MPDQLEVPDVHPRPVAILDAKEIATVLSWANGLVLSPAANDLANRLHRLLYGNAAPDKGSPQ